MKISKAQYGAQYWQVHRWLNKYYSKVSCDFCGSVDDLPKVSDKLWHNRPKLEFALRTGDTHSKDRDKYLVLCISCHRRYDFNDEIRKKKSRTFKKNKEYRI